MRPVLLMALAATAAASANDLPAFDAGFENRLGLTFSPDGTSAFWVEWDGAWGGDGRSRKIIYVSHRQDGGWSRPTPALPPHANSDDDPYVSPDGRWLYFVSDRPVDEHDEALDANIWRYSLAGDGRLEALDINSRAAEYSPVVTASGALYFASARAGGAGQGDLYRAPRIGDGFGPAEALGPAVNSSTGEWNLWVSNDESELIFEASSRPTNVSVPGDLYYSWRTPAGWTPAVPIARLNSADSDLMPRPGPDGDTLYYTTAPIGGHARIATADWPALRAELRDSYAPLLLVANRSSHDVSFVDLARGEVVTRVATGDGPHLLSNVSDGRVVATGYGEFPQPHAEPVAARPPFVESLNSRLTVIDVASRNAVLERTLDGCEKPHASWIVGQLVYVTCETERAVLVVDLDTGDAVQRFDSGQQGSHVLAFEPESNTLAVSNTDSGSVTLIDVAAGATRIVKLGGGSEGSLVVDNHLWVGNAWDGSVSVVDPRSATEVARTDSLCSFPIAFSEGAAGDVWLACFGSAELIALDRDTVEEKRRIKLDAQPLNVLLHEQRDLAYVSLPRKNAIAEIDLVSGQEVRRIEVGIEPDGLRWLD